MIITGFPRQAERGNPLLAMGTPYSPGEPPGTARERLTVSGGRTVPGELVSAGRILGSRLLSEYGSATRQYGGC